MAGSGNSVPSDLELDLLANSGVLDQLINSSSTTVQGRETPENPSGKTLTTWAGVLAKQAFVTPEEFGAVGDGVADDTAALQAAFDSGKPVVVDKDYLVSSALILSSGAAIFGKGVITSTATSGGRDGVVTADDAQNITIDGLTFENLVFVNTITLRGCSNVKIRNCIFRVERNDTVNSSVIGIYESDALPTASNNIWVHNNEFYCPTLAVIAQSGGSLFQRAIYIINNTVTNNLVAGDSPSFTTGIIKLDLYIEDSVVSGNVCDGGGLVRYFIQVEENARSLTISHNTIKNCTDYGIFAFDGQSGGSVDGVTINANSLYGCGIYVSFSANPASKSVTITANTVVDAQMNGIDTNFTSALEGVVITGNSIHNAAQNGIYCRGNTKTVVGNYVTAGTDGIIMQLSSKGVVSSNHIDCGRYAVRLLSSDFCCVSSNQIQSSSTSNGGGIICVSSPNGGHSIVGNQIDTPNATQSVVQESGYPLSTLVGNQFISGGVNNIALFEAAANVGI